MTANDKRASRRVPVALRIRLRYREVNQFISKFAVNISRGGMFLSSRNPKAIGTALTFEMRLADDSPVIEGRGVVRWIREYDREAPGDPHGMGIEFEELSDRSQALLDRIIEHRRSLGHDDEDEIPWPGQSASIAIPVEAIRRREAEAVAAAAAAAAEAAAAELDATGATEAVPPAAVVAADDDEPELPTVPRRALDPDRPRAAPPLPRRRNAPATAEVMRDVMTPGEAPAVRTALARARQLTRQIDRRELDRELAALLEADAVPQAVTVEEASIELAARLGGDAVTGRMVAVRRPDEPLPMGEETTGGALRIDPADVLEEFDDDPATIASPGAMRAATEIPVDIDMSGFGEDDSDGDGAEPGAGGDGSKPGLLQRFFRGKP